MNKEGKFLVTAVILVGMLAAGAFVGVATHSNDRTTDGFKTVSVDTDTGKAMSRNPGEKQNVDLFIVPSQFSEPDPTGAPNNLPGGVEVRVDSLIVHTPDIVNDCSVSEAKTAGIDRDNDQPKLRNDVSIVNALKEQQFVEASAESDPGPTAPEGYDRRSRTIIHLFGPNDFAGDPLYINTNGTEDEAVMALQPCVKMPDQSGWYRTWVYTNGTVETVHDDQYADQYQEGQEVEFWEPNKWYPVCECEGLRYVAMRLDPPPGTPQSDSDGSTYFSNGTLYVATGGVASDGTVTVQDATVSADQVTSEGVQFEDGTMELTGPVYFGDMQGSEGTIREDGTVVAADGTEYPPEDQGDSTGDTDGGDATTTATSESGSTDDGTDGSTDDGTDGSTDDGVAGTETEDGTGGETTATESTGGAEATDENQSTPTADDGAGFGVVAALAALVVGLVVARRHRHG